jgi:hypothetical protein
MSISTEKLAGNALALAHPDRCRVCALPLPATCPEDGICSRRCAGRRRESAMIAQDSCAMKERLLAEVAKLKAGTTICPGELTLDRAAAVDFRTRDLAPAAIEPERHDHTLAENPRPFSSREMTPPHQEFSSHFAMNSVVLCTTDHFVTIRTPLHDRF